MWTSVWGCRDVYGWARALMNETQETNFNADQACKKKRIMYQNNESYLHLLTFWGCCLHFAALCINIHGFNNLGSSVVIDPVGHSPPFLISRSRALGSAFPMSHHIYILQRSHESERVSGYRLLHACSAQHHQLTMVLLSVPHNMKRLDSNL